MQIASTKAVMENTWIVLLLVAALAVVKVSSQGQGLLSGALGQQGQLSGALGQGQLTGGLGQAQLTSPLGQGQLTGGYYPYPRPYPLPYPQPYPYPGGCDLQPKCKTETKCEATKEDPKKKKCEKETKCESPCKKNKCGKKTGCNQCYDKIIGCSRYMQQGLCRNPYFYAFMQKYCCLTCRIYSGMYPYGSPYRRMMYHPNQYMNMLGRVPTMGGMGGISYQQGLKKKK